MINYDTKNTTSIIFKKTGAVGPLIIGRVLLTFWSAFIVYVEDRYGRLFEIGPTAHTMVGLALGLLLVFRTNTVYDRYWEGCRLLYELGALPKTLSIKSI